MSHQAVDFTVSTVRVSQGNNPVRGGGKDRGRDHGNGGRRGRGNGRGNGRADVRNVHRCSHCQAKGHLRRVCPYSHLLRAAAIDAAAASATARKAAAERRAEAARPPLAPFPSLPSPASTPALAAGISPDAVPFCTHCRYFRHFAEHCPWRIISSGFAQTNASEIYVFTQSALRGDQATSSDSPRTLGEDYTE